MTAAWSIRQNAAKALSNIHVAMRPLHDYYRKSFLSAMTCRLPGAPKTPHHLREHAVYLFSMYYNLFSIYVLVYTPLKTGRHLSGWLFSFLLSLRPATAIAMSRLYVFGQAAFSLPQCERRLHFVGVFDSGPDPLGSSSSCWPDLLIFLVLARLGPSLWRAAIRLTLVRL